MNKFLFTFAALFAVCNAYSIGGIGGGYGGRSQVIGGLAYQVLPAVSVSHIPAPRYGGSAYAAPAHYAAPAPVAYAAPAPVSTYGGTGGYASGVNGQALNLALLGLSLPSPGASIYGSGHGPVQVAHGYAAPAAAAKTAGAAAAGSYISGASGVSHGHGYGAPAPVAVY